MVIQKNIWRITIKSDSQLIVGSINDKIYKSNDIIDLVEDIAILNSFFRDIGGDYLIDQPIGTDVIEKSG